MSCSRTQCSTSHESIISDPLISSLTLYHRGWWVGGLGGGGYSSLNYTFSNALKACKCNVMSDCIGL